MGGEMRVRLFILVTCVAVICTACDWSMFRRPGPGHTGQTGEPTINVANVSGLTLLYKGATGDAVNSSPAVVNGTVYVGSDDASLYVFAGAGGVNCGIRRSSPVGVFSTVDRTDGWRGVFLAGGRTRRGICRLRRRPAVRVRRRREQLPLRWNL